MAHHKKRRRPIAEINVVPYIDVMLVLLIIFMVTAPLLLQGVRVDLPAANATPVEQDKEPLIVSVDASGHYYLNVGGEEKQSKPLALIIKQVGKVLSQQPETPIFVWGDEHVAYGVVVSLMAELQSAGASSVGLVTEPRTGQ